MSGLRLGLVRRNFLDQRDAIYLTAGTCIEESVNAMGIAVEQMRGAGAEVIDVDMDHDSADFEKLFEAEGLMLSIGFKEDLSAYLSQLVQSPVRTLEELVRWNEAHAVGLGGIAGLTGRPKNSLLTHQIKIY